jgi:hypothetical protein
MRPAWKGWLVSRLLTVLPAALIVAGVGYAIQRQREAELAAWQEQEAVRTARESARAAAWEQLARRGDLPAALARCREEWKTACSLYHEPAALAYSRDALTAYFLVGNDADSLRQVACDGRGARLGPRVVHPLQGLRPAEAPPKRGRADGNAAGDEDAEWPSELRRLAARPLAPDEEAIELLADPLSDRVLVRSWRSSPQGARGVVEPADAPAFPLLAASASWRPAAGAAPAALRPLARHDWLANPGAAFARIARDLPRGARISELTLEPDEIQLQIVSPTPGFQDEPPAPFGSRDFDEYGVADSDSWYPRREPGLGCVAGETLPAVQEAFAPVRSRFVGSPGRAWYSCSTAFSNGRRGAWHLMAR